MAGETNLVLGHHLRHVLEDETFKRPKRQVDRQIDRPQVSQTGGGKSLRQG